VERADLAFVRQKLHDDDRGRKRQRHRDIERRQPVHAEGEADQEAEEGREADLPESRRHGDLAETAHEVEVELQADQEQEHGDRDLAQRLD
jgi:hypothetical protein